VYLAAVEYTPITIASMELVETTVKKPGGGVPEQASPSSEAVQWVVDFRQVRLDAVVRFLPLC
jgi:hypothetical protein